jgi:manganese transport protein
MGFVSIIGLAFLLELALVRVDWAAAAVGWVKPSLPAGSMVVVMSVLGAVVMPHNLFLHSEFIQSRQWNLQGELAVRSHLRFELFDTLFSMAAGWAINSAMVILAAATFARSGQAVASLERAEAMLRPLVGPSSALVFAVALLCAGLASTLTAGMAGGSIFAGLFRRPYDIRDGASRMGVALTLGAALLAAFFVRDTFRALVLSQVVLSVQLPVTILLQVSLTSSPNVMGDYRNTWLGGTLLWGVALVVVVLNLLLLRSVLQG